MDRAAVLESAHALSAGVDAKVVQEMLGHSSSTLSRDTYTSVVDEVKHHAAGAVARVFLAAGLQQPAAPEQHHPRRSRHT